MSCFLFTSVFYIHLWRTFIIKFQQLKVISESLIFFLHFLYYVFVWQSLGNMKRNFLPSAFAGR